MSTMDRNTGSTGINSSYYKHNYLLVLVLTVIKTSSNTSNLLQLYKNQ